MNYFKKILFIVLLFTSLIIIENSCKKKPSLPTVTTVNATSITQTTASSGGNVTSDGGAAVTAKGVCWGTATKPTITNSKTSDGTGTGAFTSNLTGLTPNTLYYVRAYATNSEGTAYGNEVSFTTSQIIVATLTTTAASTITSTTAASGGNITANGGGDITARGVCWSTAASPTTADNKTSDGTGSGTFTSSLSGLLPGTTYHIRAYATNIAGTAYGNELSFKTSSLVASLTTSSVTGITTTTAISGGTITSDGGASVIARGVCWSTTTNPLVTGSHTSDGTGVGTFTSSITGLIPNTTYYLRAYATNSEGIAYGNDFTFTTLGHAPTVITQSACCLSSNGARLNGIVNANYLSTIVTFEYGTTASYGNSIVASPSPVSGNISLSESANISNLNPETLYHFRVRAENDLGITYGDDLVFTTLANNQISDFDGNIYNLVQIGTQIWISTNLKTTRYNDGTAIEYPGSDKGAWSTNTTGAYAWYENNISNKDIYGGLYNWHAVMTDKLCPSGWHVPSDSEWQTLEMFLGMSAYDASRLGIRGENNEGGKLKETGYEHWDTPNTGATNETGFTALPGELRYYEGSFLPPDPQGGVWWTTSIESETGLAYYRSLNYNHGSIWKYRHSFQMGYSIRCLKNN